MRSWNTVLKYTKYFCAQKSSRYSRKYNKVDRKFRIPFFPLALLDIFVLFLILFFVGLKLGVAEIGP